MTRAPKPGKWVIAVEQEIAAEVQQVSTESLSRLTTAPRAPENLLLRDLTVTAPADLGNVLLPGQPRSGAIGAFVHASAALRAIRNHSSPGRRPSKRADQAIFVALAEDFYPFLLDDGQILNLYPIPSKDVYPPTWGDLVPSPFR